MRLLKKQLWLPCFCDCHSTRSMLDGFLLRQATPAFGIAQATHILHKAIPASLATLMLVPLLITVSLALKVLNMNYPFRFLLAVWLLCDATLNTNVSIAGSNGYLSLRECAALCLNDAETYVDVRSFIGCPAQPYGQNECYCREDLHISASSYITHCVTSACGPGTVDVDGAVSVYDNYCFTAVGATPVIGAVAATTTNPAGTTAGQTFTPTSNGAVETGANSKRVST